MSDAYDYIDLTPEQAEEKLYEEVRRKHYDGLAEGAQSVCERGILDPIAVAENFLGVAVAMFTMHESAEQTAERIVRLVNDVRNHVGLEFH